MPQIRTVAGTRDLFSDEYATGARVVEVAADAARLRGYTGIITPVFEYTELFSRAVGVGTDVVDKEMYTFEDRGGRSLTLRPEATASVLRAYFEGGMNQAPQPVRLYYRGPMFRAERPQAGRYRQFFQHGVEAIGEAAPGLDAEVIELAWNGLQSLGLQGVRLQVNSIGDETCRPVYRALLQDYYRPHLASMCDDCKRRFDINPLRLLDCKKTSCEPLQAGAPMPVDHLCGACASHHDALKAALSGLGVPFTENPRLVRGLDYYTRTAFEFWHDDLKGSQNALGGGGRYDGLAEVLGYQKTPAVGFSIGIDRVVLALQRSGSTVAPPVPAVAVLPAAEGAEVQALELAADLRRHEYVTLVDHGARSLKARMRQAQKSGAAAVVILGEAELAAGKAAVRDMLAGEQQEVPLAGVTEAVTEILVPR